MNLFLGLVCIVAILGLLAFDLVFIPWVLMTVLSWFGVTLALWQCIIIVRFFNIVTYGFRKK